ncbi:cytochrome p450 domain-containing protein [Ditylenchus destructor]|nr:cytochrome p450 domain-containing protein [Ditylenchus destructor]
MSHTLSMGIGDRAIVFLLLVVAGFIVLPLKIAVLYTLFCLTVAFWLIYNQKSYFTKRGIPSPKGEWITGHGRIVFENMATFDGDTMKELGTNYFGAFILSQKEYTFMDLDFIKDVAVKKFSHFQDRAFISTNNSKAAKKSIFRNFITIKTGEDWKRVRNRVTPAFTTGKIKKIIPTFNECAKRSFGVIENHIAQGKEVDLKALTGQIVMDVIGHGGFSMDFDVYSPEESPLLVNAKKAFSGFIRSWRVAFTMLCPVFTEKIEQIFGIDMLSNESHQFFEKFLLDLYDKRKGDPLAKEDKLRRELNEVVGDEEEITFEHMPNLIYMNQVIQETLRMYPQAPRLNRQCTESITLNGFRIEEGDVINFPVSALHYDPKYYPDPHNFDPERFTEEKKSKRDQRVYLPFGIGPRNCLGMRFAEFQMRVVLGQLVKNFKFEKGENSPELPIKIVFDGVLRPEKTLFAKDCAESAKSWIRVSSRPKILRVEFRVAEKVEYRVTRRNPDTA